MKDEALKKEDEALNTEPVSYTHLDVYKRQLIKLYLHYITKMLLVKLK